MIDSFAHILTSSTLLAGLFLLFIVFLESLAIVGLAIPSSIVMTTVGILIGKAYFNFYYAWLMAFIGCFLGDSISYFSGVFFKKQLHDWRWFKKQQNLLNKIELSLNQHRFFTIILGRYIGVTRPLVPIISGALNLKPQRFFMPCLLACITWPIIYLLPGIFAGAAIEFPKSVDPTSFQWLLGITFIIVWLTIWLIIKLVKTPKNQPILFNMNFPIILGSILLLIGINMILLYKLFMHPLLPVYVKILHQIFL